MGERKKITYLRGSHRSPPSRFGADLVCARCTDVDALRAMVHVPNVDALIHPTIWPFT